MASRTMRLDGLEFGQIRPVRSSSFSSDVMSNSAISATAAQQVPHANPSPAYIAQTEASDLISAELDRRVLVSEPALTLLNEFLDHVLFSIIATSHSVALGPLKAAVPAVLKPRLGKAALRVAEEELKEYIEDEEAEELYSNRNSLQPRTEFDAELVWKLARLRCMVYARMGDLEEEDEEEWLEKEHLLEQAAALPVTARQSMAVTPGSAIFLTSIIEYLGEQALYYAAQYAQKRHDNARIQDSATNTPESQLAARHADIVLEGKDMNHVGRDSPLSRLWRSWRRNTRSQNDPTLRPMSPEAILSPGADSIHSRPPNGSPVTSFQTIIEENRRSPAEVDVPESPSRIPLPVSENDVEEINGTAEAENGSKRPVSMPVMPGRFPSTISMATQDLPDELQEQSPLRPRFERQRSHSVPTIQVPFELSTTSNRDSLALPIQQQADDDSLALPIQKQTDDDVTVAARDAQEAAGSAEATPAALPEETIAANADTTNAPPKVPSRPHTAQSSEQLNTTVGVIAGALGAVGVHHVGRNAKEFSGDRADKPPRKQPSPSNQPLTSASIKAPTDFDVMYVPEEQEQKPTAQSASPNSYYQDITSQQLEEHKRYSQHAHEMDTPSIYNHRDHSPRFPKDMRPMLAQTDQAEQAASRYGPPPDSEASQRDGSTQIAPHGAAFIPSYKLESDSSVPPASSKFSNKRVQPIPEPIPELPKARASAQQPVDEYTINDTRGHSKSSSSSSRLLGFTRDASGRPHTIHQQRAAGDVSDDARKARSSTPNGTAKSGSETANSISPPRRQHLRIRADSDNNRMGPGANDGTTKRSLDVLINSDETLHYTLTPATASFREDSNRSPPRTQTQDLADFLRNTAPPGQENTPPKTGRSRKVSMEANRASQVGTAPLQRKITPTTGDVVLEKPPVPKAKKNLLGEPRDAKIDRTGGVRDLADYMRSTGPTTEDQLPKALSGSTVAAYTTRRTSVQSPPSPNLQKTPNKPQNRLKFQARDARASRNAESSALIDFIREGPPREPGDHRINRHIAPFRTTMDSDDLNALASSLPKGSSDTNGMRSIDDATLNSNTSLLNNVAKAGTSSEAPSAYNEVTTAEDGGIPKKNRRKIKDPYALDDSDDDLFEETAKPHSNEESLIDFLRNTSPSQNMTAQPILSSLPPSRSLNTTPSVDKFKDFVRGGRSSSNASRTAQVQAQSRVRAESPHLTQTGSKLDSYRPTQATHAAHVDRNRANKTMNRPESRASTVVDNTPRRGYGGTADLADYLRNTGPPPNNQQEPQPFILSNRLNGVKTQEKEGGLKKFFSMRGRK